MDAAEQSLMQDVDALYDNVSESTLCDIRERDMSAKSLGQVHALAYGEVTTPLQIFGALKLHARDLFYDLGSGRGQCVLAAAMADKDSRPAKAVGVELVEARHKAAEAALLRFERARASENTSAAVQKEPQARCSFVHANALDVDLTTSTKVFINNAVFSPELNRTFAAALSPTRAPALQRVATINPLPSEAVEAGGLQLATVTAIKGSWCPSGTALFTYTRPTTSGNNATSATGSGSGSGSAQVEVDQAAIGNMLAARREAADRAERTGEATPAEVDRIRMRTAMLAMATSAV